MTTTRTTRLRPMGLFLFCTVPLMSIPLLVARQTPLPEGKGKTEFQQVCSGCHAPEAAVAGTRRSRDGWQQVVQEMVVRGAEGSDEELALVVDYLTTHFGPPPGPRAR
jgi:mono/diheme cytochrome c family protein